MIGVAFVEGAALVYFYYYWICVLEQQKYFFVSQVSNLAFDGLNYFPVFFPKVYLTFFFGKFQNNLYSGLSEPTAVQLDLGNNMMYYCENIGKKIWSANLDGTQQVLIKTDDCESIALDLRGCISYLQFLNLWFFWWFI